MRYAYVADASMAAQLISAGNHVLQQIFDIKHEPIWIFEYEPSRFCFDINDASIRKACVVYDHLTLCF